MFRFLRGTGWRMLAVGCEGIRSSSNFIGNSDEKYLNINQRNLNFEKSGLNNYGFNKLQIHEPPYTKYVAPDNFTFKKDSWAKCENSSLPIKASEIFNSEKNQDQMDRCKNIPLKNSNTNNNILSLHIAAYENNYESSEINDGLKKLKKKTNKVSLNKLLEYGKLNPYEFPRQNNGNDETPPPEITQFKASQNLLKPNENSVEKTSEVITVKLVTFNIAFIAIKLFFEAKEAMKSNLDMTDAEINLMKYKIKAFATFMKTNLGSLKPKQKGHLMLFELPEFVSIFKTASFFSDNAIESCHPVHNNQEKRIKCKEAPTRYSLLLKWGIDNNYYFDNVGCKIYDAK